MKTKICKICKKRRIKQQEWKTKDEKEICFTCMSFINSTNAIIKSIKDFAFQKEIPIKIEVKYEN